MSKIVQLEPGAGQEAEATKVRGGFIWQIVKDRPSAAIGLGVLVIFILVALFSRWLEPHSVTQQTCPVYAPPSSHHWLGCDDGGIDMFSLLIEGAKVSLIVGTFATLVAMVLGGGVGILSGYFGGATDVTLMRITDYFLVIPDIVLAIVLATLLGPSLNNIIIVIAVILWASTARIIRAQVKSVRERVYVRRARALGAGNTRIIFRHVLPQVGPLLIANTVLTIAVAIFDETYLAFLGLGDPTKISWGSIIEHAFERTAITAGAWWAIVPAGLCVGIVIMGCYLLGQAIEDALNPRLKVAHVSVKRFKLRALVGRGADAL